MPKTSEAQANCNWAKIAQIRALNTPRTRLCNQKPAKIVETIHRLEHREKVDFRKRKGRCDQ